MQHAEFVELVRRMRASQKAYFATRKVRDLQAAKEYETAVDRELKEFAGVMQRTLGLEAGDQK